MATIQRTAAESYAVTATVPGDTLTAPAVITAPSNGATVATNTVTISGICQNVNSATLVTLTRAGVGLGSAVCGPASTFSIPVTLVRGENVILPHVQTGLGDAGPDGQAIQLIYQEPVVVTGSGVSSQGSSPVANGEGSAVGSLSGPTIIPESDMVVRKQIARLVTIRVSLSDGSPPYALRTDWGDGQIETTYVEHAGAVIVLSHTYTTAGMYTVAIEALDSMGRKAVISLVAYVHVAESLNTPVRLTTLPPRGPDFTSVDDWLTITQIVWMSYFVIVVALVVLWRISPNHTMLPVLQSYGSTNPIKRSVKKKLPSKKRHAS